MSTGIESNSMEIADNYPQINLIRKDKLSTPLMLY